MEKSELAVNISSGTIVRFLLFIILFGLLFFLRDLLLIILTAIVLASSVEPAVAWLKRYRIPRTLGVILIYLTTLGGIGGSLFFLAPPLIDDLRGVVAQLPQRLDVLGFGISANKEVLDAAIVQLADVFASQNLVSDAQEVIAGISGGLLSAASAVFGGLLSFVLILVLSFYFAVQETGVEDFLRVVTPQRHENYIVGLWKRAQVKIGLWMQGQILLAVIVGVLAYLGLTILGVPYALLLALFAAAMELVPVFGPIIAAVPAILIAISTGGVSVALMTTALFLIIQQFENHLIYPLVVKKVVGVPAILVILSLIAGAQLAGFLGIILSVPVAAALKEYFDDVQKAKVRPPQGIPIP